jgi:hypothetical protein
MLGDVVFRQAQLVVVQAADVDLRLVKVELLLGSALLRDDDGKHRFALNAAYGTAVKHRTLFPLCSRV